MFGVGIESEQVNKREKGEEQENKITASNIAPMSITDEDRNDSDCL